MKENIKQELDIIKESLLKVYKILDVDNSFKLKFLEDIQNQSINNITEEIIIKAEKKIVEILQNKVIDKKQVENCLQKMYSDIEENMPEIIFVEEVLAIQGVADDKITKLFQYTRKIIDEFDALNIRCSEHVSYLPKYFKTIDRSFNFDRAFTSFNIVKNVENIILSFFFDEKLSESAKNYRDLITSGIYSIILKSDKLYVYPLPNNIEEIDDSFTFTWMNKKYRGINNTILKESDINLIDDYKYTAEDFFMNENEEIKSALYEYMRDKNGDDYFFQLIKEKLKEVDTYVHKTDKKYLEHTTGGMNIGVYTLFKGESMAFVRCYCPSTDRMFFLEVEDKFDNAKDAIASLYQIPTMLKDNIKYIQRQGEIFSTVFDREGTEILHNNNNNSWWSYSQISGDEYFEKIRYEY